RLSGTLSIALRRYEEAAAFPVVGSADNFFASDSMLIPNEGASQQLALHWAVHKDMKAIVFLISPAVKKVQADPRFKDFDVVGAVTRGIENWNSVFGLRVLEARFAADDDSLADDDKNYLIWDANPSTGFSRADMRWNPNTGELRGASVYINQSF